VTTERLQAFSDGVFAIAITLLVLEIHVPQAPEGELWRALFEQWPSYAAYVVTFAVIGIMWVNHHALIAFVARVDRPLLFLNLLLLLFVALLPFPTALLAEYLHSPGDGEVAAAVYSGTMLGCAIGFNLLWRWIVRDARLVHAHIDVEAARGRNRRFALGILVYTATVAISFVSALLTLALHALIAVYYVFDQLATGTEPVEAGPER
jgi:uncharacterized membrane protein